MDWYTDRLLYLRNLAAIILCAAVMLPVQLILLTVYLIRSAIKNIMWLLMGAVGVAIIVAWIWRCCKEPMG